MGTPSRSISHAMSTISRSFSASSPASTDKRMASAPASPISAALSCTSCGSKQRVGWRTAHARMSRLRAAATAATPCSRLDTMMHTPLCWLWATSTTACSSSATARMTDESPETGWPSFTRCLSALGTRSIATALRSTWHCTPVGSVTVLPLCESYTVLISRGWSRTRSWLQSPRSSRVGPAARLNIPPEDDRRALGKGEGSKQTRRGRRPFPECLHR